MNFWEIVNSELTYKNIDRKQLAAEAGFNVSNISKGMKENNIPSADTAVKIAKVLGVSVEYLVTGIPENSHDENLLTEMDLFHHFRSFLKDLEKLSPNEQEGVLLLVNKLAEKK